MPRPALLKLLVAVYGLAVIPVAAGAAWFFSIAVRAQGSSPVIGTAAGWARLGTVTALILGATAVSCGAAREYCLRR